MLLIFDWFFAENLFLLLTSIVGFAVVVLTLLSFRKNRLMNGYLISIFSIISSRFFLIGSYGLQIQSFASDLNGPFKILLIAIFPLFYLYFREIVTDEKRFNPKNLIHFIFPILIFGINFLSHAFAAFEFYLKTINFVLVSIIAFNYMSLSYMLLREKLWSKKTSVHYLHYRLIRSWTKYFFLLSVFVFIRLLVSFTYELMYSQEISGNEWSITLSAFFWLIIFSKVLLSPQILFGMPRLMYKGKAIATSSILIQPFWKASDEVVHIDSKENTQMDFNVLELISDVDYYTLKKKLFRNKNFSVFDLAREVGVPVAHIEYLFKYHSSASFNTYKTHLRIQDAIQLIHQGFLNKNSMEDLASLLGFNSALVFMQTFQNATGKKPTDYSPMDDQVISDQVEIIS